MADTPPKDQSGEDRAPEVDYRSWVDDFLFRYTQETLDLERLARLNATPLNPETRRLIIELLRHFATIGVLERSYIDRLLEQHPLDSDETR